MPKGPPTTSAAIDGWQDRSVSGAFLADRYRLGTLIGRGGMADVYQGLDLVLERPVAVKVLRDAAGDAGDRARFTQEARTLGGLSHPGIVTILDAGITADQPFLVMELIDGPTLAQRIDREPVTPAEIASVGYQVAEALAYAHQRGVVHRDIKPGNVLMAPDGLVKLADFGIARLIGDTVRHTRTGTAVGTAAYLSPEQVSGADVTGAADVYSLGLVLLEPLTGERAYPGASAEAALARLTRSPHIPSDLPPGWSPLLTAMVARDPSERPEAAAVGTRLRHLTQTAPFAEPVQPDRSTSVLTRPTAAGTIVAPLGLGGESSLPRTAVVGLARRSPKLRFAAALTVVLTIMVVVLIAAQRSPERDSIPSQTPAQLEQPLRELHDAVNGR